MPCRERFRFRSISTAVMDDIILYEERRRDMMKLWKDTFHDSDRYIRLVFDNYFSLDNSFVKYHENRIIAALLCVDYEFQILTKEGKKLIRGLYLCGLATHPDWRRKGIMGSLMEEAENAAKSRGYEMTFLIPADDHLRMYYARKGYETLSWRRRLIENLRIDSSFENPDKSHIYSIQDFLKRGQREFLSLLAEWCRQIEVKRKFDTILHSVED
ncbi:MAG: GNAT family N-acetyltransferase, partial [Muribaculaceae bacterium]|nr:GNAT family N-acetyltransferase [Muribaculaceae bacterium]